MKAASSHADNYANVLRTLIKSVKLLQEATESTNLPLPSGPLAGVAIDRLETIKSLKANKDVGEELAEKIVYQVATIYHELSRPAASENDGPRVTRASVARYTKALTDAHDTLVRLSHRGLLGKSLLRGRDRRELLRMMLAVDTEFTAFMESLGREQNPSRGNRHSMHIMPVAMQDFGTSGLSVGPPSPNRAPSHEDAYGGAGHPQQHSYCWPGTRIPILDEIDHWATTNTAAGQSTATSGGLIYWLSDVPGAGKSAITASLAQEWREKGILGGYFDFGTSNIVQVPTSVGEEETGVDTDLVPGVGNITDALCEAWATQLGAAFPDLSSPILRALSDLHRSLPSSSSRRFPNQLKRLIINPLKTLQRARYDLQPHTKILFVLDSIDECPPPHRGAILQALKAVNAAHGGVKFFLVSGLPTREEDGDISTELLEAPSSLVTRGSINIHSASNMADILLYLTAQFQVHAAQFHNHSQFRTALIEPTIRVLTKRAEGVILWAKTAFEMLLRAENPTRMLLNLVEEDALSNVHGLYLELVLTAQTSLDALNVQRTRLGQHDPKGDQPGEMPSAVSKQLEAFPKNALAMVLSAIGYSTESLSVATIAELTGLGLDRTISILDLLSIAIGYSNPARSTFQPYSPLTHSSSHVNLADRYGDDGTPGPPSEPRKRTLSTPRQFTFSTPRNKSHRPSSARSSVAVPQHGLLPSSGNDIFNSGGAGTPLSPSSKKSKRPSSSRSSGAVPRHSFLHSPVNGTFNFGGGSLRFPSFDAGSLNRQEPRSSSISGALLTPSSAATMTAVNFPSTSRLSQGTGDERSLNVAGGVVSILHVTFREWIHLPHPPTLLSSLTGKGAVEEDDLRFVIAPSREGAHAMLAKGSFRVMRSATLTPEDMAATALEGTGHYHYHQHHQQAQPASEGGGAARGRSNDSGDEAISYACRYWAHHCAEMLVSLTARYERSAIYMSTPSGGTATRWKGVRGDMLEFLTRKLPWWVDTCIALNCASQAGRGLKALEKVLKSIIPEEDLKPTVEQLIQWMQESRRFLDNPNGFPEGEKDAESSLVYKYYGEQLSQRINSSQLQKVQHPPSFSQSDPELDKPKRRAASNRSAPSVNSSSIGYSESTSTRSGSYKSGDSSRQRELPSLPPSKFAPARKEFVSQTPTPTLGSATAIVHPAASLDTKVPQAARTGAPPLMQRRGKNSQTESFAPPSPHDVSMTALPNSSVLFPGFQYLKNTSQPSLPSPVSPSFEQQTAARNPHLLIGKKSDPASFSGMTAPTRSIPPPPLPTVNTYISMPSSAPKPSNGEVSPSSLTDILNMINFDSPTPGSTGATRGAGVHY